MSVPTELLGLAGEYFVASELCRRGLYAHLTLGRHKRADVLVECESGFARVQVKSKQQSEWPSVQGVSRKNDFLILVDFEGKRESQDPDVYVLNAQDWKMIVEAYKNKWPEVEITVDLRVKNPDGWGGVNLKVSDVAHCKSAWLKLVRALT